jgi:2-polyprenyl-3-methyl-5-hydroxy-6-metoxy-1,4-benzoquinol methylase
MSAAAFYDALAPAYHLNYADWSASIERQAAALESILRSRGVQPGSSVLDAACGVGTQSLGLVERGYKVSGSDISSGAVDRARSEAAERGLSIDFSVADLRSLADPLGRTFDAVIACDNAIPHLLSDEEILTAFRQMLKCTAPGGICLISVRDYAALDRSELLQARPPVVHEEAGARRILFQVWQLSGDQYELSLYIVKDDGTETAKVEVMRSRYYAVTTDTLIKLMERAGFSAIERLDEPFYQPVVVGQRPLA